MAIMLWLAMLLRLICAAAQPTCPQEPAQVVKSIGTCTSDIQRHQTGAATYTSFIRSNGPFIQIGAAKSPVVQEAFEHYQCGIDSILEKNHNYPAVPGEVGWRRKVEPKQKPLLHIHIHNDAGTTVCLAAYMNGEHVVQPNENCNWAKFDHIWTNHHHNASYVTSIGSIRHPPSCEDRAEYFAKHGFTFGSIEREVHATDYCPKQFRYSIVLRHPILSLKSYLTTEFNFVENSAIAYGFHKFTRCKVSVIDCNKDIWLPQLINAIRSKTPSPGIQGGDITPPGGPGFFGWKLIDNYKIRSIVGAASLIIFRPKHTFYQFSVSNHLFYVFSTSYPSQISIPLIFLSQKHSIP